MSGSSPNAFICQFFDEIAQLDALMEEISQYVTSLETIEPPKDLRVGDPIITRFSADQLWYRAQILSCKDSSEGVEVVFVDYGNTEVVPVADTITIPVHFTALRKQANTYQLSTSSGITFEEWTDEAFAKFEELAQPCNCLVATVMDTKEEGVVVALQSVTCMDFAEAIK